MKFDAHIHVKANEKHGSPTAWIHLSKLHVQLLQLSLSVKLLRLQLAAPRCECL